MFLLMMRPFNQSNRPLSSKKVRQSIVFFLLCTGKQLLVFSKEHSTPNFFVHICLRCHVKDIFVYFRFISLNCAFSQRFKMAVNSHQSLCVLLNVPKPDSINISNTEQRVSQYFSLLPQLLLRPFHTQLFQLNLRRHYVSVSHKCRKNVTTKIQQRNEEFFKQYYCTIKTTLKTKF